MNKGDSLADPSLLRFKHLFHGVSDATQIVNSWGQRFPLVASTSRCTLSGVSTYAASAALRSKESSLYKVRAQCTIPNIMNPPSFLHFCVSRSAFLSYRKKGNENIKNKSKSDTWRSFQCPRGLKFEQQSFCQWCVCAISQAPRAPVWPRRCPGPALWRPRVLTVREGRLQQDFRTWELASGAVRWGEGTGFTLGAIFLGGVCMCSWNVLYTVCVPLCGVCMEHAWCMRGV